MKKSAICGTIIFCLLMNSVLAQTELPDAGTPFKISPKLLARVQGQSAELDQQITVRTSKYLQRMQWREQRLRKKMYASDSINAKILFNGVTGQYAAMGQKMRTDTGKANIPLSGTYKPYIDSLRGALGFLTKNPQLVIGGKLQGAVSQFQALQAKMQDADQVQSFIQQRKQQIGQYLSQRPDLAGMLGKQYASLNQEVYYYSQQLRQYREMWDHPDQAEQKLLTLLNKLPAFETFMKNNSQLGALFNLPGDYGTPPGLSGLQTKGMVAQEIQGQLAAGGAGATEALQSSMQSAESQMDVYKNKLDKLGSGNGDMDMPDFKPNDQRTKTFWKRLEYGANFQTTHNTYYFPTVTDLGFSLGYRLGHSNVIGVGASYKVGWGNGIKHIALSSQGMGLRSFIDFKMKGSLFVTGGFEYNYTTPFSSYQQVRQLKDWSKSGLLGMTKVVSMKSRVMKKTKLQLLWDFLSYQQSPKRSPVLFRLGYTF